MQGVEDETILLDKKHQRVHHVDQVGTRILSLCNGQRSVDEIVKRLLGEYDIGERELSVDVETFFDKMKALQILH